MIEPMDTSEKATREHIQAGYRYALALTHHHFEAEDLVQEAWMRILRRYGKLRDRRVLYTTIRNLFLDRCRRSNIATFESLDAQPEKPLPAMNRIPGGELDLDVILAGLRATEREALYLNVVEGYSAAEIAKQTGQPRNTVLSLIFRAKQRIFGRNALRREVDDFPTPGREES